MRENETARVAAVLSHAHDGNVQAAVDALMHLWIEKPERDGIDLAALDAWRAIEELGAIDAAVTAGLALVRAGTLVRTHAFVDLTEQVSDQVLIELADLALAKGNVDQVAAVFLRFAERTQTAAFMEVIDRHRSRFESEPNLWQLALFVMSTSLIGNADTVGRWFSSWRELGPLRMWMVAAFAGTLFELTPQNLTGKQLRKLVDIGTDACERLEWDDSAAVLLCFRMVGDLQRGRWTEFADAMREHRQRILGACQASRLDHPIVRFANELKHAHPVIGFQLDNPRAQLPDAKDQRERMINRQLAQVVADLSSAIEAMLAVFDVFLLLMNTPHGHPRVLELIPRMAKLEVTGAGGWVRTAWYRLIRQRASWVQRVRLVFW